MQFNQQQPNPNAHQPAHSNGAAAPVGDLIFTLDHASAKNAGKTYRIEKTAAYVLTIEKAIYTSNPNKGTQGLELHVIDEDGNRAWPTLWYNKGPQQNNALIEQGSAMINAILYLIGAKQATAVKDGEKYICPELTGATIGAVLERETYKDSNNQPQTRMNLRQVYSPETMHTAAEAIDEVQQPTQVQELLKLLIGGQPPKKP